MTNTTSKQLPTPKQHTDLYNILYKPSILSSGVRCVNEDEWPIQQIVEWHIQELQHLQEKHERELEEIIGNNDVYLLPPGIKRVYGYSEDEKTRVSAIFVTGDFQTLTQNKTKEENE